MEKCYSRCASKGRIQLEHDTLAWSWAGYKYAGLQNGNQCFCGSISPPTSALVSLSECSKPCQGDQGQKCGASWRMNVYLIKTNWKYIRPQENGSLIILLFQLKTKTTNSFHINNSINQFHNTFFFSDGCSALQHIFTLNFGREGLPCSRNLLSVVWNTESVILCLSCGWNQYNSILSVTVLPIKMNIWPSEYGDELWCKIDCGHSVFPHTNCQFQEDHKISV